VVSTDSDCGGYGDSGGVGSVAVFDGGVRGGGGNINCFVACPVACQAGCEIVNHG